MITSLVSAVCVVKKVDEIKCWTILELIGGTRIHLRRLLTNTDLVAKVRGEEVEIITKCFPPVEESDLRFVLYHSQQLLYPVISREILRNYRKPSHIIQPITTEDYLHSLVPSS